MDALDVRILRTLGLQPFLDTDRRLSELRPARMADRLGVSVDTIKDRIARMEQEGVIDGYEVYPNFRHLGLNATTYHFRVPDPGRKSAAVEAVEGLDGVVGIFNFIGPDVCLDLCHRDDADLKARVDATAEIMGGTIAPYRCFEYHLPAVRKPLETTDWRILRALRGDAHRSFEEIATEIGMSARTVRRRYERMAAEGSLDVVPNADPARVTGLIVYEGVFTMKPHANEKDRAALIEAVDDHLCSAWPSPEAGVHAVTMLLVARSVAEAETLRRKVEALDGVEHAEVLLPAEMRSTGTWIDAAIEARIGGQALPVSSVGSILRHS